MPRRSRKRRIRKAKEGESLLDGVKYVLPAAAVLLVIFLATREQLFIGLVLLGLAVLSPLIYWHKGGNVEGMLADIVYGIFDVGGTVALASAGAIVGGVWGAVFGTIVGDALLNSFSGVMEGKVAVWLRQRGVKEARSPLISGVGKMSGGFLSAGFVLVIIWVNLSLLGIRI
jgi:hypothetical protein